MLRLLFLVIATMLSIASAPVSVANTLDSRVQTTLRWLPADAESVIAITAKNVVFDQPVLFPMDPDGYMQFNVLNPAWPLYDRLHQKDIAVAIQCIRLSHLPFTKARTQICTFIFLNPNAVRDVGLRHRIHELAHRVYVDSSVTVTQLQRERCEKNEKVELEPFKVCMPADGLLVCCNDDELLHLILERRHANSPRSAFPENLPEWRALDTRAPYWGIRHFHDHDSWTDKQAVGIAFQYHQTNRQADVEYFSGTSDMPLVLSSLFRARDIHQLRREVKVTRSQDRYSISLPDERSRGANSELLYVFSGALRCEPFPGPSELK